MSRRYWQTRAQGLTEDHQADDFREPHFTELKVSPQFNQGKVIKIGTVLIAGILGYIIFRIFQMRKKASLE